MFDWCYKRCISLGAAIGIATIPIFSAASALAAESTMPSDFQESIDPGLAARYRYTENGRYSQELGIPTYEWMPSTGAPKAIILGIHGLTLHGRRYRVLARSLAINGIGFISLDMRGFGASYFDENGNPRSEEDERAKVDHEKSFEEITSLAESINRDYPGVKLILLGESLGCTFCVRLAMEKPNLVTGLILSAPAVRVNRDMYAGKGQIRQGVRATLNRTHEIDLRSFFAELCSEREDVQEEMLKDPFVRKKLPIRSLLSTDRFVEKTVKWGKTTGPDLQVLIIQGGRDGCVSPTHVIDLMKNMPSDHQTLAWRGNFGHLQMETIYMRAEALDAVTGWMLIHNDANSAKLQLLKDQLVNLGGRIVQ